MSGVKCTPLSNAPPVCLPGLASLDAKSSGRMGLRAIVYYFATTFIAIIIGIVLVVSIHPGVYAQKSKKAMTEDDMTATSMDAFLDLIRYG